MTDIVVPEEAKRLTYAYGNSLRFLERVDLVGGNSLYIYADDSVGGARVYYSDEIGGGVGVWNTALVSDATLLAAISHERQEYIKEKRGG